MAKPVFVLIPGSFSPPAIYDKVIPHLKKAGYEAHALSLLSVGERAEGPATMEDDAASIHTAISNLVKSGKEVIVMMNSYGAFPGTEACKGLAKSEGEVGGVVALVYVAAYLPAVGTSVKDTWGGWTPDEIARGVCISSTPLNQLSLTLLTTLGTIYDSQSI
jgi:pimeloyl-ACP methyl ester carboxylesterase